MYYPLFKEGNVFGAVRKNGHGCTVDSRADEGIGPYEVFRKRACSYSPKGRDG